MDLRLRETDEDHPPFWWVKFVTAGVGLAFVAVLLSIWLLGPSTFGGEAASDLWLIALAVSFGVLVPIQTAIKLLNSDTED